MQLSELESQLAIWIKYFSVTWEIQQRN